MAFILGSVLIGAGASLLGGAISAKGQKDAAKTAAAGSDREIEFARESRDLARADQAPYREAGTEALDALRSLVGLGGPQGGSVSALAPSGERVGDGRAIRSLGQGSNRAFRERGSAYRIRAKVGGGHIYSRAYGGNTYGRAAGGPMYNVNEMGPENRYVGGAIRRGRNPATINGETGYVEPNAPSIMGGGKPMAPGQTGYGRPPSRNPTAVQKYPAGSQISQDESGFLGSAIPGTQPNITNVGPEGFPQENPGGVEGGYQFQTDPGYQFRFSEGMRALDRSAAAEGGLLSGGFARKAIRYGQGFASQEFGNVYNRISNIAGLGQVAAGQSGSAALTAGSVMGNAASNAANASAYGQVGAGNAWANAANQIGQLPWDKVFNRGSSQPGPGVPA